MPPRGTGPIAAAPTPPPASAAYQVYDAPGPASTEVHGRYARPPKPPSLSVTHVPPATSRPDEAWRQAGIGRAREAAKGRGGVEHSMDLAYQPEYDQPIAQGRADRGAPAADQGQHHHQLQYQYPPQAGQHGEPGGYGQPGMAAGHHGRTRSALAVEHTRHGDSTAHVHQHQVYHTNGQAVSGHARSQRDAHARPGSGRQDRGAQPAPSSLGYAPTETRASVDAPHSWSSSHEPAPATQTRSREASAATSVQPVDNMTVPSSMPASSRTPTQAFTARPVPLSTLIAQRSGHNWAASAGSAMGAAASPAITSHAFAAAPAPIPVPAPAPAPAPVPTPGPAAPESDSVTKTLLARIESLTSLVMEQQATITAMSSVPAQRERAASSASSIDSRPARRELSMGHPAPVPSHRTLSAASPAAASVHLAPARSVQAPAAAPAPAPAATPASSRTASNTQASLATAQRHVAAIAATPKPSKVPADVAESGRAPPQTAAYALGNSQPMATSTWNAGHALPYGATGAFPVPAQPPQQPQQQPRNSPSKHRRSASKRSSSRKHRHHSPSRRRRGELDDLRSSSTLLRAELDMLELKHQYTVQALQDAHTAALRATSAATRTQASADYAASAVASAAASPASAREQRTPPRPAMAAWDMRSAAASAPLSATQHQLGTARSSGLRQVAPEPQPAPPSSTQPPQPSAPRSFIPAASAAAHMAATPGHAPRPAATQTSWPAATHAVGTYHAEPTPAAGVGAQGSRAAGPPALEPEPLAHYSQQHPHYQRSHDGHMLQAADTVSTSLLGLIERAGQAAAALEQRTRGSESAWPAAGPQLSHGLHSTSGMPVSEQRPVYRPIVPVGVSGARAEPSSQGLTSTSTQQHLAPAPALALSQPKTRMRGISVAHQQPDVGQAVAPHAATRLPSTTSMPLAVHSVQVCHTPSTTKQRGPSTFTIAAQPIANRLPESASAPASERQGPVSTSQPSQMWQVHAAHPIAAGATGAAGQATPATPSVTPVSIALAPGAAPALSAGPGAPASPQCNKASALQRSQAGVAHAHIRPSAGSKQPDPPAGSVRPAALSIPGTMSSSSDEWGVPLASSTTYIMSPKRSRSGWNPASRMAPGSTVHHERGTAGDAGLAESASVAAARQGSSGASADYLASPAQHLSQHSHPLSSAADMQATLHMLVSASEQAVSSALRAVPAIVAAARSPAAQPHRQPAAYSPREAPAARERASPMSSSHNPSTRQPPSSSAQQSAQQHSLDDETCSVVSCGGSSVVSTHGDTWQVHSAEASAWQFAGRGRAEPNRTQVGGGRADHESSAAPRAGSSRSAAAPTQARAASLDRHAMPGQRQSSRAERPTNMQLQRLPSHVQRPPLYDRYFLDRMQRAREANAITLTELNARASARPQGAPADRTHSESTEQPTPARQHSTLPASPPSSRGVPDGGRLSAADLSASEHSPCSSSRLHSPRQITLAPFAHTSPTGRRSTSAVGELPAQPAASPPPPHSPVLASVQPPSPREEQVGSSAPSTPNTRTGAAAATEAAAAAARDTQPGLAGDQGRRVPFSASSAAAPDSVLHLPAPVDTPSADWRRAARSPRPPATTPPALDILAGSFQEPPSSASSAASAEEQAQAQGRPQAQDHGQPSEPSTPGAPASPAITPGGSIQYSPRANVWQEVVGAAASSSRAVDSDSSAHTRPGPAPAAPALAARHSAPASAHSKPALDSGRAGNAQEARVSIRASPPPGISQAPPIDARQRAKQYASRVYGTGVWKPAPREPWDAPKSATGNDSPAAWPGLDLSRSGTLEDVEAAQLRELQHSQQALTPTAPPAGPASTAGATPRWAVSAIAGTPPEPGALTTDDSFLHAVHDQASPWQASASVGDGVRSVDFGGVTWSSPLEFIRNMTPPVAAGASRPASVRTPVGTPHASKAPPRAALYAQ